MNQVFVRSSASKHERSDSDEDEDSDDEGDQSSEEEVEDKQRRKKRKKGKGINGFANQSMFKDLGISDTQIAFWTSIIMMPWTLKFLWSPFLEMYKTKKFFVVLTQLLSGLLFGVVAFSLNFDYFFAISISTMAVLP